MKRYPCLILALSFVLMSCSPRVGDSRHRFEVDTVDGVRTAINNGIPKYSDPLFSYEEILRFQEDPDNEESILTRPSTILLDESGTIYIEDSGDNRIAVFNDRGEYVRSIGREGEGPGEFQSMDSPMIHDGLMQIYDRRLHRLSLFTTAGELEDMIQLGQMVGDHQIHTPMFVYRCRDGSLIVNDDELTSDEEIQLSRKRVFIFDPDGQLRWQTETPHLQIGTWVNFRGVRGLGAVMPYASRARVDLHPDHGILVSPADEPVLRQYALDGALQRRIEIQLGERPFTAEDRSVITRDWNERVREASGISLEQLQSMRDGMAFPERWAYWSSVSLDDAGYIWLGVDEHEAAREAAGFRSLVRVVSPEGEYLGDTRLPRGAGPVYHGHPIARVSDPDTGEITFVVYRLVPSVEGFAYP